MRAVHPRRQQERDARALRNLDPSLPRTAARARTTCANWRSSASATSSCSRRSATSTITARRPSTQLAGWLRDARLELHSVHAPIVEHLRERRVGPAALHGGRGRATRAGARSPRRWRARDRADDPVPLPRRAPRHPRRHEAAGRRATPALAAQRSLTEIAAAAAPLGVQVAVEVIPNKLSAAPSASSGWSRRTSNSTPPGVGICLDMGHAFLMGDLADAIEIVSGRTDDDPRPRQPRQERRPPGAVRRARSTGRRR